MAISRERGAVAANFRARTHVPLPRRTSKSTSLERRSTPDKPMCSPPEEFEVGGIPSEAEPNCEVARDPSSASVGSEMPSPWSAATLADGLGHGPDALVPACRAVDVMTEAPEKWPTEILKISDSVLARTRGAVMSAVRIDEASGSLRHAAVGNVMTHVYAPDSRRSFSGSSFVLGAPGILRPKVLDEQMVLEPHSTVVMFSDGLKAGASFDGHAFGFHRHPLVIAHHLLKLFGRTNDDATVLVIA